MNAINKHLLRAVIILSAIVAVPLAWGAETVGNGDRVVVPLSDATRPAFVKAHLVQGSITVKGGAVNNIVVEARVRESEHEGTESGMHRIPVNTTGLQVEEENNRVDVGADSTQRTIDLTITVPTRTSLSLHTVNDGDINVTNVDGELDVNDVNGSVTLKGVSGTVVAHALNGKVLVTLNRINPSKPMAFSSLNGDIDVTFPPDLKANLVISSDHGEVLSDFDVALQARAPEQIKEDTRGTGGSYHVKIDKTVHGTINGGGQEIQFRNFNGNIYIRKAGAKG